MIIITLVSTVTLLLIVAYILTRKNIEALIIGQ